MANLFAFHRGLWLAALAGMASTLLISPTLGVNGEGFVASAAAKGDDEEEEGGDEGGGDDNSDDDEGGESGGDEGEDEEEPEDAKDQPPVTAGGLYTIKTYPIRELSRPLNMPQGILQMRLGLGVDVSAKTAFESVGHVFDARYGARDNFTVFGGFNSAYNFKDFSVYAGFEGGLAYDLINFRAAARVGQSSIVDPMSMQRTAGKTSGHIDVGFPFRYVARPELAIVALDTLMSIDFDSKPDLNPSLGISTNPIPPVSIVVFAQLQIKDFDTTAENFLVPATARIQFSPTHKFDLGAEFRFDNVKPPEGEKFYDKRFLSFYTQLRF